MVKPPIEGQRKSRRFKEIERKENRQVNHRLHQISKDFVNRCYEAGVATIVLGDLTGIHENIQYGTKMNQRLHAWSFAKLIDQIKYKAAMKGIKVVQYFRSLHESNLSSMWQDCEVKSQASRFLPVFLWLVSPCGYQFCSQYI